MALKRAEMLAVFAVLLNMSLATAQRGMTNPEGLAFLKVQQRARKQYASSREA